MKISIDMTVSHSEPRWTYSAHGPSFHHRSHEEIRTLCRNAGFSGIEAHAKLFPDMDGDAIEEEGRRYRAAGLKIDSFHLPYGVADDVAALYETGRRAAVETMKTTLHAAARLGARVAILHPSTARLDLRVESFDTCLRALGRSLEELLPLAETLNIVIALENLPSADMERFGTLPEHFCRFHEQFAHPNLGFCLDTGHALISRHAHAAEFHDAMKPAIAAFHLEDNAGDRDSHLAPGRGLVNWSEVARYMEEVGFVHAACVEAPPFAHGLLYSSEAWCELHEQTCRALGSTLP